jgi:hypothetical protein
VALDLEHVAHELSVLLVVFDDEDQFASHLILPMSPSFRFTLALLRLWRHVFLSPRPVGEEMGEG